MAKINCSYRLFEGTVAEIRWLTALKYGKNATQVIERAVHAAIVANLETKPKPKRKK